jgi:hypothetical protein
VIVERNRLRLGLLASTQLIVALDYNIVYVALPDIGDALGALLLFGGRARSVDRLAPRRMFITGSGLWRLTGRGLGGVGGRSSRG